MQTACLHPANNGIRTELPLNLLMMSPQKLKYLNKKECIQKLLKQNGLIAV